MNGGMSLIADPELPGCYGWRCEGCGTESIRLGWDALDAIYDGDNHDCQETK